MAHAKPDLMRPWTVEEFLTWEREQEERFEYVDGVIRMMVGGTPDHKRLPGTSWQHSASACAASLAGSSWRA